jgi:hypothetical protein
MEPRSSLIRVLVAGLPQLLRDVIRRSVTAQAGIEIAGETAASDGLLNAVDDSRADVVVVDAVAYSREQLQRVVDKNPRTKLLALRAGGRSAFLLGPPGREVELGKISPSQLVKVIATAFSSNPTPLSEGPSRPARVEPSRRPNAIGELNMNGVPGLFGPCDCTTPVGLPFLSATLSAELQDDKERPIDLIPTNAQFVVEVHLILKGSLLRSLCGFFCIAVYADEIGECPEIQPQLSEGDKNRACVPLNCRDVTGSGPDSTLEIEQEFTFGPIKIDPERCPCPYQFAVVATFIDSCKPDCNGNPGPIACFCKGPLVQFFVPGP